MEHPWHWQPTPLLVVGFAALLIIFVALLVWGNSMVVNVIATPLTVVIGVVQYRLTTIALGKRN